MVELLRAAGAIAEAGSYNQRPFLWGDFNVHDIVGPDSNYVITAVPGLRGCVDRSRD